MAASSGRKERSPMLTPPTKAGASPASAGALALSLRAGNGFDDDAVWRRLREAELDEESIRRRDKAALIAYVAKLERELYEYQHSMGLLLIEKKDWDAKCQQAKAAADLAETTLKEEQAAHASAVSGSRKSEENLKKALAVQKECVLNLEKALHEIRKEYAEMKIEAETKLANSQKMAEDAQEKCIEAHSKQRLADLLQEDASRCHSAAERKMNEAIALEDDLRRKFDSRELEFAAKNNALKMEREHLYERQKAIELDEEKLFEKERMLSQREQFISDKSMEVEQREMEIEKARSKINEDVRMAIEEKTNLRMISFSLEIREKEVLEKEKSLDDKEKTLLILHEKIMNKKFEELQRIEDECQARLEDRKAEVEAELEVKRISADDEIEAKRKTCELLESKLRQGEKQIKKNCDEFQIKVTGLKNREADLEHKMAKLKEKEDQITAAEERLEKDVDNSIKERDNLSQLTAKLRKLESSLRNKEQDLVKASEEFEADRMNVSTSQIELKEVLDGLRAQRMQLSAEAEDLCAERERFETKWQLIEDKGEELRIEALRVAEERKRVSEFLKDEKESLQLEKDTLHKQFKQDVDSVAREREEFINQMNKEQDEWVCKIQKERANFMLGIELQKRELEESVQRKNAELERGLKEKEYAFKLTRAKELELIDLQKEQLKKESKHIEMETEKLVEEKRQIVLDREKRESEWKEISDSIQKLETQRQRLQEQREFLQREKEKMDSLIKELKYLEELKCALEKEEDSSEDSASERGDITPATGPGADGVVYDVEKYSIERADVTPAGLVVDVIPKDISLPPPSLSTPLSWFKKCAHLVFKSTPDKNCENVQPMNSNNDENTGEGAQGFLSNGSIGSLTGRKRNGPASHDLLSDLAPLDKKRKTGQDATIDVERVNQTSLSCETSGHESSSGSSSFSEDPVPKPVEEAYLQPTNEIGAENGGELDSEDNEDEVIEEPKSMGEKVWTFLVT